MHTQTNKQVHTRTHKGRKTFERLRASCFTLHIISFWWLHNSLKHRDDSRASPSGSRRKKNFLQLWLIVKLRLIVCSWGKSFKHFFPARKGPDTGLTSRIKGWESVLAVKSVSFHFPLLVHLTHPESAEPIQAYLNENCETIRANRSHCHRGSGRKGEGKVNYSRFFWCGIFFT